MHSSVGPDAPSGRMKSLILKGRVGSPGGAEGYPNATVYQSLTIETETGARELTRVLVPEPLRVERGMRGEFRFVRQGDCHYLLAMDLDGALRDGIPALMRHLESSGALRRVRERMMHGLVQAAFLDMACTVVFGAAAWAATADLVTSVVIAAVGGSVPSALWITRVLRDGAPPTEPALRAILARPRRPALRGAFPTYTPRR